jgi:hypothetical protein
MDGDRPAGVTAMSRRRRLIVWGLIVLTALLVVAASVTAFAKREALDSETFADSSARLLGEEPVRRALATFLVGELYGRLDVAAVLREQLPAGLDGLAAPAAAGLRAYATRSAEELLASPRMTDTFRQAVYRSHVAFLEVVERGGARDASVELRPAVLELAERIGLGERAAGALPPDAGTLTIARSQSLAGVRTGIRALRAVSLLLALLIVGLAGAALVLARGWRREALLRLGLAVVAAGAVVLLARRVAGQLVVDRLVAAPSVEPAAEAAYLVLTDLLGTIAWTTLAAGALAAGFAWLAGPAHRAVRIRARLAPALAGRAALAPAVAAALALVVVWVGPVDDASRLVARLAIVALIAGGIELVRRQTLADAAPAPVREDTTIPTTEVAK